MRLWPRSIAGRTTLVLIGGIVAVMWLATGVWWVGSSGRVGPPGTLIALDGVATIAAMVDRLPPERRADALRAVGTENFRVRWSPTETPAGLRDADWMLHRIERLLREALAPHGLSVVDVGHPVADGGERHGDVLARIRLTDGSWLSLAVRARGGRPSHLIGFIAMIAVAGTGLAGLAVWVSRRVTAPLGRFAAAASRLGTNVDAPPLAEDGPSEIREAARAFNQMQQRIRRYVEDRTRMLAAISHDLRTVATRLRLRADYIEDPEQRAKALADLDEMQVMLEATLSFARDEAAAEARTTADLSSLLQTLCDGLADAGQKVAFEGPPRVALPCRPVALRRAFANLIDNAVSYGGEAQVTLAANEAEVIVVVADRGPGIAPDMREQVFAPFFRLEGSRSRETGGTGLGLSLVRDIVRGHGGDVTLADRPGGGLVVRVTLPRPDAGPGRAPTDAVGDGQAC